jgi:hypothetical protein
VRPRLVNLLAVLSLTVSIAAIALWVRSLFAADFIGHGSPIESNLGWGLASIHGSLHLMYKQQSGLLPVPGLKYEHISAQRVYAQQDTLARRWGFGYDVRQSTRLIYREIWLPLWVIVFTASGFPVAWLCSRLRESRSNMPGTDKGTSKIND